MSKPKPTHFLNLPLLTSTSRPQLAKSLSDFRTRTSSPSDAGPAPSIPAGAYRPLGTLHLTLGVLHLPRSEQLNAAVQLLREMDLAALLHDAVAHPIPIDHDQPSSSSTMASLHRAQTPPAVPSGTPPPPLTVSFRGLDAFPSAGKATVLHAVPHDPSQRLLPFCRALRERFVDGGAMDVDAREMVLHASVVNTVYVQRGQRGRRKRVEIDATRLMEMFNGHTGHGGEGEGGGGEYVWANDVLIDRVRICKMGAQKVEDRELGMEYEVVAEKVILGGRVGSESDGKKEDSTSSGACCIA